MQRPRALLKSSSREFEKYFPDNLFFCSFGCYNSLSKTVSNVFTLCTFINLIKLG